MAGIYKKIGDKIAANPDIIRPHVKALDITHLNFKKMKEMGMEKIIFAKDFTLTKRHDYNFLTTPIRRAFERALYAFGTDNVLINS